MSGGTPDAVDAEGRKTGPWTDPDPHGGVMVGEYVAGERHGVWRHLRDDGAVRAEGGYDTGELHGAWSWYRTDGRLMQRGAFDHGEKHGPWERWDAAGRRSDAGTWKHGRRVKPD